jgi:Rab-like protein 2
VTEKKFAFAEQNDMPFYFVSAADGTNVVKIFNEALKLAK